VSRDGAALQELLQLTGQMAVPVITAGSEIIVGFDQPRLQRLAERFARPAAARRPALGALVRDAAGGGVLVGDVRPGSPADAAGLRPGDVVEAIDGAPVTSTMALERILGATPAERSVALRVRRGDRRLTLTVTLADDRPA